MFKTVRFAGSCYTSLISLFSASRILSESTWHSDWSDLSLLLWQISSSRLGSYFVNEMESSVNPMLEILRKLRL